MSHNVRVLYGRAPFVKPIVISHMGVVLQVGVLISLLTYLCTLVLSCPLIWGLGLGVSNKAFGATLWAPLY